MLPEDSQDKVRGSHTVRQVDLDPVHQRLQNWLRDGHLANVLVAATNRQQGHEGFTHTELVNALPGFGDLNSGERGAVVASLARLSLAFHRDNAVGHNPLSLNAAYEDMSKVPGGQTDVSRGVHYHERANIFGTKKSGKDNPARKAFNHLKEKYGKNDALKPLIQLMRKTHAVGEHRPDFTARNYAVLEVRDPKSGETYYVVDSSIPQQTPDEVHSEPHLGNHLELVNKLREKQGMPAYEPTHLYTEREPCGNISGSPKADCSSYIHTAKVLAGVEVHYSVGFRRGELDDEASDMKSEIQRKFTRDMQSHLNRLAEVWMEAMILQDQGYWPQKSE